MSRAAARPRPAVPDRAGYLAEWSTLHGGFDLRRSRLVRTWLGMVHAVAAPLARAGLGPGTVTVGGVVVAVAVPLVAFGAGGVPRLALLCAVLVFGSGFVDNLDGAVAVLTGRTTRTGYVLDSVADRVADLAYLWALWILGAPGPLVAVAGVLTLLQEYTRARAAAGGMDEVGVVSIGERPTRVIVAGAFLLGAGVYPGAAGTWVTVGTAVWVAVHAVGLVQVSLAVRRALR